MDAGPEPTLALHLLGGFAARIHGPDPDDARDARIGRSGRRLLTFLGLHGRPLRRARIAVELWPSADSAQASANLRAALRRLPHPDEDDDWLLAEQEHHRQRRLHALERIAAAHRRDGRTEEALAAALLAVAGDPLRESAHRQLIHVHLAQSNAAEALRQYDVYRRLLRRRLGLTPSATIRGLVVDLQGRPADRTA